MYTPAFRGIFLSIPAWLLTCNCTPRNVHISLEGRPQNADVGESGHQIHKKANKSGNGQNPAAHHARRFNTLLALSRVSGPEPYTGFRYCYSRKRKVFETVTSGSGCQRVLTALAANLPGGISDIQDAATRRTPTAAASTGKYPGSAMWRTRLLPDDQAADSANAPGQDGANESWVDCVAGESGIRPHTATVLRAASSWFGCGRREGDLLLCSEPKCPTCWEDGPANLHNTGTFCSRFKHGMPPKASSGLGRLKGGDVKSATSAGSTPRGWAVGAGQGEDVEIFTTPTARASDLSGDGDVTLAKILYFFDIEGNRRAGGTGGGPTMEFVLVYEYVTCGRGRSKKEDPATKHPTYWLRGGPSVVPSVFPVDAVRRHVHMSHLCPVSSFEACTSHTSVSQSCGLRDDATARGGGKVWCHEYNLASSDRTKVERGDAYMLNEHWRGVFQDGVV